MRYLSKSRFKEGLECITRLYYTGKKDEYANQTLDDPFLQTLAEGGFQVGELAKYLFCDDPIKEDITVDSLDYQEALRITSQKFSVPGKVVIAEAAFNYENLFIRADLIVKEDSKIDLYEVKAKSFDGDEIDSKNPFISDSGKSTERINSKWTSYLYDLSFQKYVISKAFPDFEISANLILTNKSAKASIDGLNQLFQVEKVNNRARVKVQPGLKSNQLGKPILSIINLDELIDKIWYTYPMPVGYGVGLSFEEYVKVCSDTYLNDTRIFSPIKAPCRDCPYQTTVDEKDKKSGLLECWMNHTNYTAESLSQPLVFTLWQGRINKALENGRFLLAHITNEDIKPAKQIPNAISGLNQYDRRLLQIQKAREKDNTSYFDKTGFDEEMNCWTWPLHMIDFETSTVALPFYKDTTPYQGIAFQFSHHVMYRDGRIEHRDQFIHFEKGKYPNLEFIRELKNTLSADEGTIFRYHNHENTYLRMIYRQIVAGELAVTDPEKEDLLKFIDCITRFKMGNDKNYTCGNRNMVDLYDLVLRFYYPPSANGKIGLKYILPAIIRDSEFLRNKYSNKGIYGKQLSVTSLNFDDHQWINDASNNDPYKTLPRIFNGYDRNTLDSVLVDFEGVADGGAALTAYNYLQYTNISDEHREKLKDALLRYCELDTMAMVMLIEGLMNLEEKM